MASIPDSAPVPADPTLSVILTVATPPAKVAVTALPTKFIVVAVPTEDPSSWTTTPLLPLPTWSLISIFATPLLMVAVTPAPTKLRVAAVPTEPPSSWITTPDPAATTPVSPEPSPTNWAAVIIPVVSTDAFDDNASATFAWPAAFAEVALVANVAIPALVA